VVFWALMSVAGLLTELLFSAAGLVPTVRPTTVAPAHFSWNYTTYLNLIFLVLFGVLYWLYRNRERLGGGDRTAQDPVCGMQVEKAHAPATREHDGERHYFCSDHCAARFQPHRPGTDHASENGRVADAARAHL
jgi:YHS domain-containing protein